MEEAARLRAQLRAVKDDLEQVCGERAALKNALEVALDLIVDLADVRDEDTNVFTLDLRSRARANLAWISDRFSVKNRGHNVRMEHGRVGPIALDGRVVQEEGARRT
jgi:hypothetical protein